MSIPKAWTASDVQRLKDEFEEQDKDRNGLIDGALLFDLLKHHFGAHCDDQEIRDIMPAMDKEDTVVFEEFLHYLTTDTTLRFDFKLIRHMRQKWEDRLGLQLYLPFVALFIFYLLTGKGLGSGYWQTFVLNDIVTRDEFDFSDDLRFEKFYGDVGNEEEFWQWANGPLLGAFWQGEEADDASSFVQFANMPIGAMKVRSVRVAPEACGAHRRDMLSAGFAGGAAVVGVDGTTAADRLKDFPYQCYGEWDGSRHDSGNHPVSVEPADPADAFADDVTRILLNESMVDPDVFRLIGEAFQHRECGSQLNGSITMAFEGKAGTYGCSGYAVIIPFSWPQSKVTEAFSYLENGVPFTNPRNNGTLKWVDLQTRALSVELFTFNQNLQLFSRLQYLVEVTAGGAYIPVINNINFKLFQWSASSFGYHFFMFLFFVLLCLYFTSWCVALWKHATDWMIDRRRRGFCARLTALVSVFFSSYWTVFDLVNYVFFFTVWGFRFVIFNIERTDTPILENNWYPDSYETVARATQIVAYLDSINGLLCVGRVFYYLRLNTQFNVLTKTIEVASSELVGLLLIFFLLFTGFCLMGYVVFGQVVEDYRNVSYAVGTLLRYLVGDFDFEELREQRRLFAPIFFTLFQVLCFFLLLNMVIAVLSDAFAQVETKKWRPALLRSLMQNTDEDAYEAVSGQTLPKVVDFALVREGTYWFKTLLLEIQNLCNRDEEWVREYERVSAENRALNPRLFWEHQERAMADRKCCAPFCDKLNLCPINLHSYLVDGEDDAEEGDPLSFHGMGSDFNVVADSLVFNPAEKMDREPQDLLLEMLEAHHYWYQDVHDTSELGRAVDDEDDERVQKLRDLERGLVADSDDSSSDDGSGESEDANEQELREEQEEAKEALARQGEQWAIMNSLSARVGSISSNKQSLAGVITRAVAAALQAKYTRKLTCRRIEDGTSIRLRIHKLHYARYGRYLSADAAESFARNEKRIRLQDEEGTTITDVVVRQGQSQLELELDAQLRGKFPLEEGKKLMFKHSITGMLTGLAYTTVQDSHTYIVTTSEEDDINLSSGEWPADASGALATGQGPRNEEFFTTFPDCVVLQNLRKQLENQQGLLSMTVSEKNVGRGAILEADLESEDALTESTLNDYPEDYVEEVELYNQLELVYEPVTTFRDHLESTMVQLIRKRLPNLMLETLSARQLMSLLSVKYKRADWKLNHPKD